MRFVYTFLKDSKLGYNYFFIPFLPFCLLKKEGKITIIQVLMEEMKDEDLRTTILY